MAEDWMDVLARLKGELPAGEEPVAREPEKSEAAKPAKKEKLSMAIEKKGRGGKTATIIFGFEGDDEVVAEVARKLKQSLGIGGSARGGEILLQGDCRAKARELLRAMGYKLN